MRSIIIKLFSAATNFAVATTTWNNTYWGVCRGIGENNLGKILMIVREELAGQK